MAESDSQKTLIIGTGVCCLATGILLMIILIPLSVNYVEYNEIAFKKNTLSNFVDQETVYENGRYLWGPSDTTLAFPSTFQKIEFRQNDLLVFSTAGLEFSIECDVYYRLNVGNLSNIFDTFGTAYQTRFYDAVKASIKNTAPEFQVDDFVENRRDVTNRMFQNLNSDLEDLYVSIEPHKFLLLKVAFPASVDNKFLATAIQEQTNIKAEIQQEVDLIVKETERLVEEIQANTTIVQKKSDAQAKVIVERANAAAFRINQQAIGEGINKLLTTLNITDSFTRSELFELLNIIDNPTTPRVILGSTGGIIVNLGENTVAPTTTTTTI